MNYSFIKNKSQYDQYRKLVSKQICLKNNLPDQVFKNYFSHHFFDEFSWCLSDEFMIDLKKLMESSKDDHVLMAVLSPNPQEYYYKNFGYYNWAIILSECNPDEYYSLVSKAPPESPADTVSDNSETIVWIPPSLKWGIYGNYFTGMAVLATNLEIDRKTAWKPLDNKYLRVIQSNYQGRDFETFKGKLFENFS